MKALFDLFLIAICMGTVAGAAGPSHGKYCQPGDTWGAGLCVQQAGWSVTACLVPTDLTSLLAKLCVTQLIKPRLDDISVGKAMCDTVDQA